MYCRCADCVVMCDAGTASGCGCRSPVPVTLDNGCCAPVLAGCNLPDPSASGHRVRSCPAGGSGSFPGMVCGMASSPVPPSHANHWRGCSRWRSKVVSPAGPRGQTLKRGAGESDPVPLPGLFLIAGDCECWSVFLSLLGM